MPNGYGPYCRNSSYSYAVNGLIGVAWGTTIEIPVQGAREHARHSLNEEVP